MPHSLVTFPVPYPARPLQMLVQQLASAFGREAGASAVPQLQGGALQLDFEGGSLYVADLDAFVNMYSQTAESGVFAAGTAADDQWLHQRVRHTHDLWHVVAGCPPIVAGEVALNAVNVMQLRWPGGAMLLGADHRIPITDIIDARARRPAHDRREDRRGRIVVALPRLGAPSFS